MHTTALKSK